MNIVILDRNTLTVGDLDFSCLDALGNTVYYNVLPQEQLVEVLKDADAVLINKARITDAVMEALPKLKYIGLFATGYNNVDIEAADRHGISVVNIPGYSTDAVAQLAFSFILQHAGNVPLYDAAVHRGEWIYADSFSFFPFPISELSGKTIGIVGFGNIGHRVAEIARAFHMHVLVYTRSAVNDREVVQTDLSTLFQKADYISLHCPLTRDTENLVNADLLQQMKPSAFLINTSRGGVVDSAALADALNQGRIAGAGIDVLKEEPMQADEPLYHAQNCIITPHIGWAAAEARKRCLSIAAENLAAWIKKEPRNVVNHPQLS